MTKHNPKPDRLDSRDVNALIKMTDGAPATARHLKADLPTMNRLYRLGFVTKDMPPSARLDPRSYTHWTITAAGMERVKLIREGKTQDG